MLFFKKLHWYWAELAKSIDTADITWYDIIEKRMATMARLLQEQGRTFYCTVRPLLHSLTHIYTLSLLSDCLLHV